ncbi:MAG: tRNA pseudouridine(13) synthase TruD [Epsilonproteobacteria bacterium]|nr:tRNA pseudouridine(13) synthase TruD [Campylobacterota bacterium]
MDRVLFLDHTPLNVHFSKNSRDFVVDEVPLYEPSGEGEHLMLKIRKKDMTTWEMIQKLSEVLGCKVRDIGYAGLKDKDGLTSQYVTVYKKYEKNLSHLNDNKIKILQKSYHVNKLKIGHLKGNNFFIRLKKVNNVDAKKIEEILNIIQKIGSPNYFGYQRFGIEKNNFEIGKEILLGKKNIKNKKKREFFINAYQSHIFNLWLSKRVEISKIFNSFNIKELKNLFVYPDELIEKIKEQKNFFKILPGDIAHHYPYGKAFECLDIRYEAERFVKKEITITGLLAGKKAKRAVNEAGEIEKDFISEIEENMNKMHGSRRFAWIFPQIISHKYKKEDAQFELSFFLPKGAYATVLLEEIIHKELF